MSDLEKRLIIAARPRYYGESELNFERRKCMFRCFVVLEELEEKVLALCLKYPTRKELFCLTPSRYPFLKESAVFNGEVYIIDKEHILLVSDEKLEERDLCNLNRSLYYELDNNSEVSSYIEKYLFNSNRELIKNGSIVTIDYKGYYKPYYVVCKNDESFDAILLTYYSEKGLSIKSNDLVSISYNNILANVFYLESLDLRIKNDLNEYNSRKLVKK